MAVNDRGCAATERHAGARWALSLVGVDGAGMTGGRREKKRLRQRLRTEPEAPLGGEIAEVEEDEHAGTGRLR